MLVDSIVNQLLDSMLGSTSILPGTVWIGLMLSSPNPDGSGINEPIGNGYARVSVANDVTHWPAAASRQKTHGLDITWAAASGTWGTVTHGGIFTGASGSNLVAYGSLSIPRLVANTDIFRFLAGTGSALVVTIPNVDPP